MPNSKSQQPRIAVAGFGQWGANLTRNFAELGVLATVFDTSEERRAACRSAYPLIDVVDDFKAILEDKHIQAVALATPAPTHTELARLVLEADKDVFVEKPLSLSVNEGQGLVELSRRRGRLLMVGHVLRYHPAIVALKQLVDEGELGKLQYLHSTRLNLGRVRKDENILWSFAPHDVSVVLSLLGETPDEVQAHAGQYLQENIADITVSLLGFPSGAKAHFFVSWLHPFKEQKLVVIGDRMTAVFDDQQAEHKLMLYPHKLEWKSHIPRLQKAPGLPVAIPNIEPLREECRHFIDCVAKRTTPLTDGEEGLRVLQVLETCQKALIGSTPSSSTEPPPYTAHASAFIDKDVDIGAGTAIWHVSHILRGSRIGKQCRIGQNVVVGPDTIIGDNCKIQNNVSVYEGVSLEDSVFCGPSVVFTNVRNPRSEIPRMAELQRTLVKQGATLGANATIVCGTTIGRYAFIAAGSVVTKDVPDHTLVMGSPARAKGFVCRCAERIHFISGTATCTACGRRYAFRQGQVEMIEEGGNGVATFTS